MGAETFVLSALRTDFAKRGLASLSVFRLGHGSCLASMSGIVQSIAARHRISPFIIPGFFRLQEIMKASADKRDLVIDEYRPLEAFVISVVGLLCFYRIAPCIRP